MGRPKLPNPKVPVAFRMEERDRNGLDVIAHYYGMSRSELILKTLQSLINDHREDSEFWELMVEAYIEHLEEKPATPNRSDFMSD